MVITTREICVVKDKIDENFRKDVYFSLRMLKFMHSRYVLHELHILELCFIK